MSPCMQRHHRGFTLVELMVTVVVVGIMLRAAIPMFGVWIGNQKIRTAGESVYAGLQVAKQEAVRRNARVLFQALDPTSTAWAICEVQRGTTNCDPAIPIIQARDGGEETNSVRMGATANIAMINAGSFGTGIAPGAGIPAQVMFDAMGRTVVQAGWNNTVRFDFRDPNLASQNVERRIVVVVSPAGSPRMCDPLVAVGNPRAC